MATENKDSFKTEIAGMWLFEKWWYIPLLFIIIILLSFVYMHFTGNPINIDILWGTEVTLLIILMIAVGYIGNRAFYGKEKNISLKSKAVGWLSLAFGIWNFIVFVILFVSGISIFSAQYISDSLIYLYSSLIHALLFVVFSHFAYKSLYKNQRVSRVELLLIVLLVVITLWFFYWGYQDVMYSIVDL